MPGVQVVEKELVLSRTFDAPRSLVFKAWTDPEMIARWWGPHHFTNPVVRWDARAGGEIYVEMKGPDGTVYPMTGRFEEVSPIDRLVFQSAAIDGALEVHNTITFEDAGSGTKVTVQARVVKATAEAAFALSGMEAGWTQSLERLAAEVEKR